MILPEDEYLSGLGALGAATKWRATPPKAPATAAAKPAPSSSTNIGEEIAAVGALGALALGAWWYMKYRRTAS